MSKSGLDHPSLVSVPDVSKLRQELHDAHMRNDMLRRALEEERNKTDEEKLAHCERLISTLKEIADHAVANLHPEFIRDLPAEAFYTAAALVATAIGATQRDSERAGVWSERADLIQKWRDKRKARGWGEEPEPPKEAAWWKFWQ